MLPNTVTAPAPLPALLRAALLLVLLCSAPYAARAAVAFDGAPVPAAPLLATARKGQATPVLIRGTFLMTDVLGRWRIAAEDGTHIQAVIGGPVSPDYPDDVAPGAAVLVRGKPYSIGPVLYLYESALRRLEGSTPLPGPLETTIASAHSDTFTGKLITVSGRLGFIEERQMGDGRYPFKKQVAYLTAMMGSDADGKRAVIIAPTSMREKLESLKGERIIRVTGYHTPIVTSGTDAPQIWVRSLDDIVDAGATPDATRRNLWWGGAGAAALLLACLGFIFAQREKLRRQKAESAAAAAREQSIRENNALLEQRVAERTAELEAARAEIAASLHSERELGEMKSRFVTTVSHEFRTPLGIITSAADIMRRYRDQLSPEMMEEHLNEIRQATRHMSGMMEDILFLGRAEAGRLRFTARPLDLVELIQRLADETRSAAHQTGTTVITSDLLPGKALVDEMLLRHIVTNLLSNAVKYSPDGAEIRVHIHAAGPEAVITIADQGIGISEADAARLFEPFARGSNVGNRAGTGLGLVVVRRCVELHGGSISFTSTPGTGTTFIVHIPAWPGAPAA